jgi:hypothetical protein
MIVRTFAQDDTADSSLSVDLAPPPPIFADIPNPLVIAGAILLFILMLRPGKSTAPARASKKRRAPARKKKAGGT